MAGIVKITKDQPFVYIVPLIILNADDTKEYVDADSLRSASVTIKGNCETMEADFKTHEHFLVIQLPATLKTGVYAVNISAVTFYNRPFTLRIKRAFEVVNWDYQSNWRDFIVGDEIYWRDHPFVAGYFNSDEDLAEIKRRYREIIEKAVYIEPISNQEIDEICR